MNDTSFFALVTFTTVITAVAAGCEVEGHGCTQIGCEDQVQIVLTKVGSKFAGELPLEIVACVDDQCATVTFGESGGQFTCSGGSANAALCAGSPDGSIDIALVPKDPGSAGGTREVHVTVKDSNGKTLFDAKDSVTLEAFEPNGPDCAPTCFEASATFQP